mgnify:CR=1 FL=1
MLAFDYPSEFSLITGILAGTGFNIVSGEVFTDEGMPQPAVKRKRFEREDLGKRRRIIDHFSGVVDTPLPLDTWADELRSRMEAAIRLLEKGDEPSITEAKQQVNEGVVRRLSPLHQGPYPVPYPVEIQVEDHEGAFTRLRVVSEDTPAFLYSLSNALALHGILIERVRIRTVHGRIEDEIDACLEAAEIHRRVQASGGPALPALRQGVLQCRNLRARLLAVGARLLHVQRTGQPGYHEPGVGVARRRPGALPLSVTLLCCTAS